MYAEEKIARKSKRRSITRVDEETTLATCRQNQNLRRNTTSYRCDGVSSEDDVSVRGAVLHMVRVRGVDAAENFAVSISSGAFESPSACDLGKPATSSFVYASIAWQWTSGNGSTMPLLIKTTLRRRGPAISE